MKKNLANFIRNIKHRDGEVEEKSYRVFLSYFNSKKDSFILTGIDDDKKTFEVYVQLGKDEVVIKSYSTHLTSTYYLRDNFITDCQIVSDDKISLLFKAKTTYFDRKNYLLDIKFSLYDNDNPQSEDYHIRIEAL